MEKTSGVKKYSLLFNRPLQNNPCTGGGGGGEKISGGEKCSLERPLQNNLYTGRTPLVYTTRHCRKQYTNLPTNAEALDK